MGRLTSSLCLVLGLAACNDSTGPSGDITGSWELVGYTDAGIPAITTGTAIFRGNGTFTIDGTVTFPGEPADQILVSGTWSILGNIVILNTGGQSGRWALTASRDGIVLTLEGSQPPTTMTLRRLAPG